MKRIGLIQRLVAALIMVLSFGLTSCGNPLKECKLSELENVVDGGSRQHMLSEAPSNDMFLFSSLEVEALSEGLILEKAEGENWYVLYSSLDETKNAVVEYEDVDDVMVSLDLSKACEQFGTGKYRVLRPAVLKDTGENGYVAREIVILDSKLIETRKNLEELLPCTEIERMELSKGSEKFSVDAQKLQELADYTFEMQCVGVMDEEFTLNRLGGKTGDYYVLTIYLSDGTYLTIRNSQGKDLTGNEYSAMCKISGMGDGVLLYGKQEWIEVLLEKIQ